MPPADSIEYGSLAVGDGDVVLVKCPCPISDEDSKRLREHAEHAFPGNQVLVLGDGIDIVKVPGDARLGRIEWKLDALIKALGEDDGEGPSVDLEGNAVGGERDQSQAL